MADMQRFVGYDVNNNPITEDYHFHGDARYTARSEEAADISNWNMMLYQNNYNDPSNQVQRLRDAGLNPNFFLGNNAGTTPAGSGGSASGHQMTSASGQTGQALDALGQVANSTGNAANVLLQQQKQAWEYDIAKRELQLQDRQVAIQEAMLPYNQSNTESQTNKNVQDVEESKTRQEVMYKEIDNLVKDGVLKDEQASVLRANVTYIEEQTALAHEMQKTESSKRALNYAEANLFDTQSSYYKEITQPTVDKIKSELKVNDAEAKKIFKQISEIMADTDLKRANERMIQLQADLTEKYGDAEKVVAIINSGSQAFNNICSGINHLGENVGASSLLKGAGKKAGAVFNKAKSLFQKDGTGGRANQNTTTNPFTF